MKTVIYGRVSKEEAQDYSRQLFELRDYAKKNKLHIVEEFTEKVSGTKEVRVQYDNMIEYVQQNNINNIIVTELTRFGRLGHKTRTKIEDLAANGVNIFFKDKGLNTLKNGKRDDINMMVIGLLCDLAEQEIITLQNRIKSGLRYSASKNGALSGKFMPYGYKVVDKKNAIDQNEAKVIKLIFDLYIKGKGASQIAKALNDQNIPTRYAIVLKDKKTKTKNGEVRKGVDYRWSSGTVTTMLKNPIYIGERHHKDEIFANPDLQIVDTDIFEEVQRISKEKGNRSIRTIKNDNYLKGIIKCGVCGQPYYMHMRKNERDSAYKCLSGKLKYEGKDIECNSPSIGINKLLNSILVQKKHIIGITKSVIARKKSKSNYDDELKAYQDDLKKLDKKMHNLIDMREEGSINKAIFLERKKKIDDQIEAVNIRIEKTKASKFASTIKVDSSDLLPLIRTAIKSVTISAPSKKESKVIGQKEKETIIKVTITSKIDDTYSTSYYLKRYSDTIINNDGSVLEYEREEYLKMLDEYVNN